MKTEKDIIREFVKKHGKLANQFLEKVKVVDKITEDMHIVCVRTDKIEPIQDSAISNCIFCGHDVYVARSTYQILPENIQAKFICHVCIEEVLKKNGRIRDNNDNGKT